MGEGMRNRLPNRRGGVTRDMTHKGKPWTVSIGFDAVGAPVEVFTGAPKAGTEVEALARDSSILLSLALQYGCPLEEIQASLTRGDAGEAQSILGEIIDIVQAEADHHLTSGISSHELRQIDPINPEFFDAVAGLGPPTPDDQAILERHPV